MKSIAMTLLLVAVTGAVGCGEKGSGGGGGGGGGPMMTEFRIGPEATRDGIVSREADTFRPGEAVHISFKVKNVPADSKARVVWSDSSKRKIAEAVEDLGKNGLVTFEFKEAPTLPEGEYLVEFFYGPSAGPWSRLGEKPFRIGPK